MKFVLLSSMSYVLRGSKCCFCVLLVDVDISTLPYVLVVGRYVPICIFMEVLPNSLYIRMGFFIRSLLDDLFNL